MRNLRCSEALTGAAQPGGAPCSTLDRSYASWWALCWQSAGASAGKRVWVWSVLGPSTSKVTGSALAQKYVADVRTARGPVMVLVGESNNAISLQAETAGGAAGAAMEVELKLLTTPA